MLTPKQTVVPTTYYTTVPGPATTATTDVVEQTTITSLCPVTETKTIGGSTVLVTWTSTEVEDSRSEPDIAVANCALDHRHQEADAGRDD